MSVRADRFQSSTDLNPKFLTSTRPRLPAGGNRQAKPQGLYHLPLTNAEKEDNLTL